MWTKQKVVKRIEYRSSEHCEKLRAESSSEAIYCSEISLVHNIRIFGSNSQEAESYLNSSSLKAICNIPSFSTLNEYVSNVAHRISI